MTAPVTVQRCPDWTEADQRALEGREAARRASRLPGTVRRSSPRVCRRRPVSEGVLERLRLTSGDLKELRRRVLSGEVTVAELARRLGTSRSTMSRLIGGSYSAQ